MIKELYDKIAASYDKDIFGIFQSTREVVERQFKEYLPKKMDSALDFAIGTGNVFLELVEYIDIKQMYGNDISSGMLQIARKKLGPRLRTICDDLANIHQHVNNGTQDLVLCHYVFSYCDLDRTMASAMHVLKPGGYCSFVSTTKKNFEELFTERFKRTARLLNVEKILEKVHTPKSHEHLLDRVAAHGFSVVKAEKLKKQVSFESYKDVKLWAIDSGWAASFYERHAQFKYFLTRLYFTLARIFSYPLYPVKASTDISVVLVQKPL